jgi:hypothetical protein
LWPETVAAIHATLDKRPTPKSEEDAALVFVTKYGESWAKAVADSPITKEMRKLLNKLGIDGQRNFYTLRHTFRTVADESKDQPAVDYIMGHVDASMAGHYRERIDDSRLKAVTDHVRAWLFASEPDGGNEGKSAAQDGGSTEESDSLPEISPDICSGSSSCDDRGKGDTQPVLRLFIAG